MCVLHLNRVCVCVCVGRAGKGGGGFGGCGGGGGSGGGGRVVFAETLQQNNLQPRMLESHAHRGKIESSCSRYRVRER